jgi:hypothetical protein
MKHVNKLLLSSFAVQKKKTTHFAPKILVLALNKKDMKLEFGLKKRM